jgi:acetylornithine deacetylase/succinyl-diaminopimelate desuccinylase-like protein
LVPPEFHATFDIRISPNTGADEFEKLFQKWIAEAEGDEKDSGRIHYTFLQVSSYYFFEKIFKLAST